MPIKYTTKELYFEYDNFTPFDEDTCGVYFLSSNTVMLCIAFLTHYGKWRNRYSHDLNKQRPDNVTNEEFYQIIRIVDRAIGELMADCNLDRMTHSLVEIEFTLKHLLTKLTDETEIKFFIDKPGEPAIDPDTGEWDKNDNKSIVSEGVSVFTVGSLLENNSITDVLKIATLDDGTIGFPDINPFNLESKLDQIRTDITEAKDIHSWFASAFYSGKWSDLNPWSIETFFSRFNSTFNDTYPFTQIIKESFYGLHKKLNDNVATSFNETNVNGVAQNSYFRSLHTWLSVDWKLFQTAIEMMSDCVCGAKEALINIYEEIGRGLIAQTSIPFLSTANEKLEAINGTIAGLQLSPTIEVSPTPVTVNACCDEQTEAMKDMAESMKEIAENVKDNGSKTVDNGDGSFTTTPNDPPSKPLDPSDPDPNAASTAKYKPTLIKRSNWRDAKCGFIYYYMTATADMIDDTLEYVDPWIPLVQSLGKYATVAVMMESLAEAPATGGLSLTKAGVERAVITLTLDTVVTAGSAAGHNIADMLRNNASTVACGNVGNLTKGLFLNLVAGSLVTNTPFAAVALEIASLVWDYSGAADDINAVIDMNDYAQYCPCPSTGDWAGQWWNGLTGHGENRMFLDGSASGTGWSIDGLSWKKHTYAYTFTVALDNPLHATGSAVVNDSQFVGGLWFHMNEAKTEITTEHGHKFYRV